MEIKHPPENGSCSCKECYKSMSKLDELDKEFDEKDWGIIYHHDGKEWYVGYHGDTECTKEVNAIKSFARKYYEVGKLEERAALKKMVERMTSMMIYTEGKEIEFVEKADLLNELN